MTGYELERYIVDEIEYERKRQGVTITELSERSSIAKSTYYQWIEKKKTPGLSALACVLRVLGLRLRITRKAVYENDRNR